MGKLVQGHARNTLAVQDLPDTGPSARWNADNPNDAIEEEDVIVQVNGISGTAQELQEEMKKNKTVTLKMERHGKRSHFKAELKKTGGDTIGVKLGLSKDRFQVMEVLDEGVVAKYNEGEPPERNIQVGDYIIEVNGDRCKAGKAKEMAKTLGWVPKAKEAKEYWTEAQKKIIPGFGWEQVDEEKKKPYLEMEKKDTERFEEDKKTYESSESTLVLMIVREA